MPFSFLSENKKSKIREATAVMFKKNKESFRDEALKHFEENPKKNISYIEVF